MKTNHLFHMALGLSTLALLTACGADHHASAPGAVPRPVDFVGIWMGDQALREYSQSMGDLKVFCAAAALHPVRHGVTVLRGDQPSVRIMQIVKGGTAYRWSPTLERLDPNIRNTLQIGRIDNRGVVAERGFRSLDLGAFQLTAPDRLAQTGGDNLFPLPPAEAANQSQRDLRLVPYTDQRSSPDRETGFTRVDKGFAEAYVSQIRRCFPECFSDDPVCPANPSTVPEPPRRSTDLNFDNQRDNTPDQRPVAPPAPARRSGHKGSPTGGAAAAPAPQDDEADVDATESAPRRRGAPAATYDPAE